MDNDRQTRKETQTTVDLQLLSKVNVVKKTTVLNNIVKLRYITQSYK